MGGGKPYRLQQEDETYAYRIQHSHVCFHSGLFLMHPIFMPYFSATLRSWFS